MTMLDIYSNIFQSDEAFLQTSSPLYKGRLRQSLPPRILTFPSCFTSFVRSLFANAATSCLVGAMGQRVCRCVMT